MSTFIPTSEFHYRDESGQMVAALPAGVVKRFPSETERTCRQCGRTQPLSHFGFTEAALAEMPGVDDFCQTCFCA